MIIDAVRDRAIGAYQRSRTAQPYLITILLIALSLLDLLPSNKPRLDVSFLLSVLACFALIIRNRLPILCYLLVIPGMAYGYVVVAGTVALYSVVVHKRLNWRWALLAGAPLMLSVFVVFPLSEMTRAPFSDILVRLEYASLYALAPVAIGRTVVTGRDLAAALEESRRERRSRVEATVQQAVTDERLRIARELHDSVAHQITLVSIRSAALNVSSDDPQVRQIGDDIRTLTSRTLRELRSTLAVLRSSGAPSPPPDGSDVQRLIATCTNPVQVLGDLPDDLDPAMARTVYRLVQESLTNAQRHAPGAPVRVSFRTDDDALLLTVENSAPGSTTAPAQGAGLGLIGLEERVKGHRGEFRATNTPTGGWRVSAVLPTQ